MIWPKMKTKLYRKNVAQFGNFVYTETEKGKEGFVCFVMQMRTLSIRKGPWNWDVNGSSSSGSFSMKTDTSVSREGKWGKWVLLQTKIEMKEMTQWNEKTVDLIFLKMEWGTVGVECMYMAFISMSGTLIAMLHTERFGFSCFYELEAERHWIFLWWANKIGGLSCSLQAQCKNVLQCQWCYIWGLPALAYICINGRIFLVTEPLHAHTSASPLG